MKVVRLYMGKKGVKRWVLKGVRQEKEQWVTVNRDGYDEYIPNFLHFVLLLYCTLVCSIQYNVLYSISYMTNVVYNKQKNIPLACLHAG